jgi:hypothetical protein
LSTTCTFGVVGRDSGQLIRELTLDPTRDYHPHGPPNHTADTIGLVLPMSVGAILMSLSTIVVAANAQLLRRLDLRPDTIVPTTNSISAERRPTVGVGQP